MEFTSEQLNDIFFEGGFYLNRGGDEEDFVEVNVIEEGDWQVEHKHEYCDVVFEYEGKYYMYGMSRSGSYWSDYHWEDPEEAYEVKQVEVVTTVWRAV